MTDTQSSPPPRKGRGRHWLLIGSIALNLFFIAWAGAVTVRHWIGHQHGYWRGDDMGWHERRGGPMVGMRRLLDGDFEDHPELSALRERHADLLRAALEDTRMAHKAARDVLRDPDRDPATLEAALLEVRRATRFSQQAIHETILDAAQSLSPDDFKTLMRKRHWHRD